MWRKDSIYKLKVRMQEVSVIQEYEDTDLHSSPHKKGHASRILTDKEANDFIAAREGLTGCLCTGWCPTKCQVNKKKGPPGDVV